MKYTVRQNKVTNMGNIKNRNSNMELLRVLAMVMVLIYHISYHCVMSQLFNSNNDFCQPVFFKELFLVEGAMSFGMIANAIFILISGYFMVEKSENINLGRVSKKLLLQTGFAAVTMVLVTSVYYKTSPIDSTTVMSFIPITDFNNMNWYVGYYFAVIVLAGLFLNHYLEKIDKKKYTNLLLVMFALFSFAWAGQVLDGLSSGIRLIVCGLFLYALGGYIKKYDPFGRVRNWALFCILIITYLLVYLSYYNNVQSSIQSYIVGGSEDPFSQPLIGFENFGIVPIVVAAILLELFKRISIPRSCVINYIGASTFMVYLIHDNVFWRTIWLERDWIDLLADNPIDYIIYILKWTGFMFAIGAIAYTGYISVVKLFIICRGIIYENN